MAKANAGRMHVCPSVCLTIYKRTKNCAKNSSKAALFLGIFHTVSIKCNFLYFPDEELKKLDTCEANAGKMCVCPSVCLTKR